MGRDPQDRSLRIITERLGAMSAVRAFGVQTSPNKRTPGSFVFNSLKSGVARVGWSYQRGLDLRTLKKAREERRLRSAEQKAWRGNWKFLTEVKPGDLLFYRNVPERGRVTIVRITGDYEFRNDRTDFRSARTCRIVATGRLLEALSPALRTALKIQGRFYEIRNANAVAAFSRKQRSKRTGTPKGNRSTHQANVGRRRRESILKRVLGYSYISPKARVVVAQRHEKYKKALKVHLEDHDVSPTFEKDFVDVRFLLGSRRYLGEIKVTNPPRTPEAFRMALGQLLEYRHITFSGNAAPIMFLDRDLDDTRLEIANALGISVVSRNGSSFRLLNPKIDKHLRLVFSR